MCRCLLSSLLCLVVTHISCVLCDYPLSCISPYAPYCSHAHSLADTAFHMHVVDHNPLTNTFIVRGGQLTRQSMYMDLDMNRDGMTDNGDTHEDDETASFKGEVRGEESQVGHDQGHDSYEVFDYERLIRHMKDTLSRHYTTKHNINQGDCHDMKHDTQQKQHPYHHHHHHRRLLRHRHHRDNQDEYEDKYHDLNQTVYRLNHESNLYIIDVNLLNADEFGDLQRIYAEDQYFRTYPEHGEFIYWHTTGTKINSTDISLMFHDQQYMNDMIDQVDEWLPDQLVYRVERLHMMLNGKTRLQHSNSRSEDDGDSWRLNIIYVHCLCGCDRTGELSGAYKLRYHNYSWHQVNMYNAQIMGRPMGCDNYLALQWYCYYLNRQDPSRYPLECHETYPCTNFDTFTIMQTSGRFVG